VVRIADRAGHREGDGRPTNISAVKTTNERATRLMSAGRTTGINEPDLPVYLVTMHGRFVFRTLSPPPGFAKPRGSWLTVSVEAKTGDRVETSLGDQRPALERLGKVLYVRAS
jgi:hypothetical protein